MSTFPTVQVKQDTVFVGCNRTSLCASWGRNGFIGYGAGNLLALYSPDEYKIVHTLRGHTGRVNTVEWLPPIHEEPQNRWNASETEIITGSSDSTLIVWKRQDKDVWMKANVLKGHKDSVTSVSSLCFNDGTLLIASTSADCTVNIWKREKNSEDWILLQTIPFAPKMMECVTLAFLPSQEAQIPLMALGGVDSLIHLYIYINDKFCKLLSLQGHEDWIRCAKFATLDNGDLMLATSSQDTKIRLWKITTLDSNSSLLTSLDAKGSSASTTTISSKGHIFRMGDIKYTVLLESVLAAHEEWVYSVQWLPPTLKEGKRHQEMSLLSSSMDKSMIIWRPSSQSGGLWIDEVHVGEIGGNTLGFYGGLFHPNGNSIIAHGYNGALHLWTNSSNEDTQEWVPQVAVSGHFGPVVDMGWDPTYQYLVTVSEDQTARCFAEWVRNDEKEKSITTWHEISRPLLHGHDLSCMAFVKGTSHRLATGAEEKVLRIFDAPQTFVDTLQNICKIKTKEENVNRPLGANVPPLGLSNKPVFQGENENSAAKVKEVTEEGFQLDGKPPPAPTTHEIPPFEDHLLQSTLWPEIHKLYGHPNELVAIASSYDGRLIASSCKGTQPEESSIRVWDTTTWKEVGKLTAHKLTVVQLEFSHDDQFLLSASRDRQFCVFQIIRDPSSDTVSFTLQSKVKAHERIVWTAAWSMDDKYIATGSRDKTVKIWEMQGDDNKEWKCQATLPTFNKPVTAVAWAPIKSTHKHSDQLENTLAVGLENGLIQLWVQKKEDKSWTVLVEVPAALCHVDTIRRFQWRDLYQHQQNYQEHKDYDVTRTLQLASCSTDHSVRVLSFHLGD